MRTQNTKTSAANTTAARNTWTCSACEGSYKSEGVGGYRAANYFARRIARREFGPTAKAQGIFWGNFNEQGVEWHAVIGSGSNVRSIQFWTLRA